ncbi:hypothetical protein L4D00_14955 [Photobacterium swingsii]|uniref:hypothetical protein n=1 Tax=Photobacterium swingsii TaxID=680026 RepID=UPI003D0AF457
MSNISISLSANTANYVQRIRGARKETDREAIRMEQRFDKLANSVQNDFTNVNGAINTMMNGIRGIKFGGYVAGAGAATIAGASLAASLHTIGMNAVTSATELNNAARMARMSAQELQTVGAVVGTAGISLQQFGDQSKDLQDKLGDYLTTGAGGFTDFFDTIRTNSSMTIRDLQGLSSVELFQTMYNELEKAGASSEQIKLVFESVSSESSKMIHLWQDGGAEYKRLSELMKRDKLVLMGSTMEEIQGLDASLKAASNNMEVYFSERFVNMTKMLNEFGHDVSKWMNQEGGNYQVKNTVDVVTSGNFQTTSLTTADQAEAHLERLKKAKSDEFKLWSQSEKNGDGAYAALNADKFNKEFKEQTALVDKAISDAEKRLEDLKAREAGTGTANIEGDSDAAKLAQLQTREDSQTKIIEDSEKRRLEMVKEAADARAKANATADQKERDRLIKNAELYDQHAANELKTQEISKSNLEKLNKDKIELQRKDDKSLLESKVKYATDATEKAKAEHAKELFDHKMQLDTGKMNEETYALAVKATNQTLANDLKAINDSKLQATRDAEDKRLQAQLTFAVDGAGKLNAQYNIDVTNLKRSLDSKLINTATYQANLKLLQSTLAKDEAALEQSKAMEKLGIRSMFATTDLEQRKLEHDTELQELKKYRDVEGVTDDMYLNKKAQIERDFNLAKFEENKELFATEEEFRVAKAESDLEFLTEQLMNEDITEDEFDIQRLEKEKELEAAREALNMSRVTSFGSMMGELASMSEEGSRTQKVFLAMEKAAKLAEMGMMMETNAMKAKSAAMGAATSPAAIAAGEAAAIASRIKDGVSMAMVASTAIGQFHNGGEVDQTGSYILKAGERVVAPDTNKELKQFLKTSDSSGAIQVDAPLTIQGDTTISEQKLLAMMATQRESIARLVTLAQRENPSMR